MEPIANPNTLTELRDEASKTDMQGEQEQEEHQKRPTSMSSAASEARANSTADCAPLFQSKLASEDEDREMSSYITHGMERLQSASSGSTNVLGNDCSCDQEHESPSSTVPREQCFDNIDWTLRDHGGCSPQNISILNSNSPCSPIRSEELARSAAADSARSADIKLPQQPASNPVGTHNPGRDQIIPGSHSSTEHEPPWKDCATQTVIGPTTFRSGSTRPTSVPNFKSKSVSRGRREEPAYPEYADPSFTAFSSHYQPPIYQPHSLRTRSSQSSHNPSYSSDSTAQPAEFANLPSGAKTVGNTPSQSPGLFAPSMPRSRPATHDSEDPTMRTPTLPSSHNLHLQEPIE